MSAVDTEEVDRASGDVVLAQPRSLPCNDVEGGKGGKVDKNSARIGRRPLEVRQDVSELKIASGSLWVARWTNVPKSVRCVRDYVVRPEGSNGLEWALIMKGWQIVSQFSGLTTRFACLRWFGSLEVWRRFGGRYRVFVR